jgi:hypothetical protein
MHMSAYDTRLHHTQPEALPAPAKMTAGAEHAAELLPDNGINI